MAAANSKDLRLFFSAWFAENGCIPYAWGMGLSLKEPSSTEETIFWNIPAGCDIEMPLWAECGADPSPMPGLTVLEWELELGSLTSHIMFDTGSCCRVDTCKSLKNTFKNHEVGRDWFILDTFVQITVLSFSILSGDVQKMLLEVKEIPKRRKTKIKGQLSPISRFWKVSVSEYNPTQNSSFCLIVRTQNAGKSSEKNFRNSKPGKLYNSMWI